MVKKNVHIVPHMHWDREWYFTAEESQILLINNMKEIMDFLETHSDYPAYVLDGQTAVLDDYLAAKPENQERIAQLVREGRLKVGPWYTQTDEMVVGAESITRNLLYGLKDSRAFGRPMMIGYVPDSFGQSAQMPQILNQFNIHRSLFWRGCSERKGTNQSEFIWKSSEGSSVMAQNFPLGYAIGKYLPTDKKMLKQRMEGLFSVLDVRASGMNELIPNGHDQMPIQKDIFEVISTLRKLYPDRHFELTSYEDLFDDLDKQDGFDTIEGEFIDGKYERVHRSIYSTRMDLKATNARIENKITNELEPLASLASSIGLSYEHGLIELIWKELMKNHAHDSIGACCSDKVQREIMARYRITEERVDRLIGFYQRRVSESVQLKGNEDRLTLFNVLPGRSDDLITATVTMREPSFSLVDRSNNPVNFDVINVDKIDPGLIDRQIVAKGDYRKFNRFTIQFRYRLPEFGFETLKVIKKSTGQEKIMQTTASDQIETQDYRVTFNSNGTLTLTDKASGQRYENILGLENQGDAGDEYDFSPLKYDKPIYSAKTVSNADISIKEAQETFDVIIKYDFLVPADLSNRLAENPKMGKIGVTLHLIFSKTSRTIHFSFDLCNHVKDQRTRVLVPTNIITKAAISDNQFGKIIRPIKDTAIEVWKKEKWAERPDPIFPFLSYVSVTDKQTVSVFTNSSREYEVLNDGETIAVTLFRSVGTLGKPNLIRRPGRPSGINAATPDSQMLKNLRLNFAIRIDPVNFNDASVACDAKEYLTPIMSYNQIPYQAMHLNESPVTVPARLEKSIPLPEGAVLSVVKQSEDGERYLARIFNPTSHAIKLPSTLEQVNLAEKLIKSVNNLLPNQVVTLVLRGW
ncbi:glycoside hydrolase family 38 C-terminal domain-containing protein [Lacticaseibacillus casei]|uniref:Glycoside hydrolase family 38 C-terminal domain-containing protein n=1 Tax=Lacticaseibacillus casei TaxID=1582 RepID=A0ABZ0C1C0_LACCA|nr:glycoside hydrolase family 38 C-terminal domain-containing protein [Lacticaseibacillus casei]KAB1970406.1 alpha-mannosidase [Lacticaseibacillus casei]WNX25126.1 glycoside hydrolase family 38 C-terminal domain-containing protein [Lacticaseibacillus casei]WNX27897.1 glycoside hydrolase family 38 C-terminal domain-containing protein [Lacticaseibacillus casei]